MKGKRVLITAGPTREYLDPVRFLSNPSSGKMGFALGRACLARGARVALISGPVELAAPWGASLKKVESARQMFKAARKRFGACDVFIAAAAVADFRPLKTSPTKIKKGIRAGLGLGLRLRLVPNPDILAIFARNKGRRLAVGFAAETDHLLRHARQKCLSKNLDMIVANRVGVKGSGFGSDYNRVTLLWPSGAKKSLPCLNKDKVAEKIVKEIGKILTSFQGRH